MPPLRVENLHSLARFQGREIGTTEWLAVTQELIQRFAKPRRTGSGFTSNPNVHRGIHPTALRLPTVS